MFDLFFAVGLLGQAAKMVLFLAPGSFCAHLSRCAHKKVSCFYLTGKNRKEREQKKNFNIDL